MQSAREIERRSKRLMLPLRRAIAESKALSAQIKVKRDKLRAMIAQFRVDLEKNIAIAELEEWR